MSFRFRRGERLKSRDEIREVFKRGKSVTCFGAKLFMVQNRLPYNRIAFTFARHFGNAVERNRARRLGREAYRHIRHALKPGYDVVLLVYPAKGAAQKDVFAVRMEQLKILFSKAGLHGN
ncbi:MAG: ribonuclease P protein component [Treponema sp.]|nr:ribonuclease P protein component [Treponema sp.]